MPWLPGLRPQREIFWSLAKVIFKETPREKAGSVSVLPRAALLRGSLLQLVSNWTFRLKV